MSLIRKDRLLRQRPPRNDNLIEAFIMCLRDHCGVLKFGE